MKKIDLSKISSRRRFRLFFSDGASFLHDFSLGDIIYASVSEDYEYAHSLMDNFASVLDLRVGQAMSFLSNRDDRESLAIIKRIS